MSSRHHRPALVRLRRIPLFRSLTRKQLVEVDRRSTELTVDAGRVLQHEGVPASAFFAIETGGATVTVGGRPVRQLSAGDVFGAVGLLERQPNVTTVTATARTDLVVFAGREFRALLDIVPDVSPYRPSLASGRQPVAPDVRRHHAGADPFRDGERLPDEPADGRRSASVTPPGFRQEDQLTSEEHGRVPTTAGLDRAVRV
jgi:signal-transduction protein with cAMP-binding, CBS, and nucleotidyltransferase domain